MFIKKLSFIFCLSFTFLLNLSIAQVKDLKPKKLGDLSCVKSVKAPQHKIERVAKNTSCPRSAVHDPIEIDKNGNLIILSNDEMCRIDSKGNVVEKKRYPDMLFDANFSRVVSEEDGSFVVGSKISNGEIIKFGLQKASVHKIDDVKVKFEDRKESHYPVYVEKSGNGYVASNFNGGKLGIFDKDLKVKSVFEVKEFKDGVFAKMSRPELYSNGEISFNHQNNLYLLDNDADLKEKVEFNKIVYSTKKDENTIISMSLDGEFSIYDKTNKKFISKKRIEKSQDYSTEVGPIAHPNGGYVVVNYNDYVYFLNPDGSLKSKYKNGGSLVKPTVMKDGTVIVGGWGGVHFFSPDGVLKGFVKTKPVWSQPTILKDGTIAIQTRSDGLHFYKMSEKPSYEQTVSVITDCLDEPNSVQNRESGKDIKEKSSTQEKTKEVNKQ